MLVQIDNIFLNTEWIEPIGTKKQNVVIIFLHEALGSIPQWKSFPQDLCDELSIQGIVYERQGHGQSTPLTKLRTSNYLHEYALEELPKFIEKTVNEESKIILVGHSDGGTIALLFAHKFPKRVLAVITMAAHVVNEEETIDGIHPAVTAFNNGKLAGLTKYHGDKTETLFYAWADTWRSDDFKSWNIVEEIGSHHPYLCIQGMDDQYGTMAQLRLIQSKTQASLVALQDCGHHPHIEHKATVVELIYQFLKQSLQE